MAEEKDWRSSKKIRKRTAYLLDHPDSEIPSDITFVVGDGCNEPKKIFKCHKFILALVSSVFQAMFYGSFEEVEVIELPDITPFAFEHMLRFAYADECTFEEDVPLVSIFSTLYCAKKYLISKLLRACRDRIQSHLFDAYEASDPLIAMEQARFLDEGDIADIATAEIRCYSSVILNSAGFLDLPLDSVKHILEQDRLSTAEPKIYRSVCRWVKCNMDSAIVTLREAFGSLLYLIRFPLFTPVELADGPMKDGVFTDEEGYKLFQYFFATWKPALPFATVPRARPDKPETLKFILEISRINEELPFVIYEEVIYINLRPDLAPGCTAFLKEIVGGEYFLRFGAYPNEHHKECAGIAPAVEEQNVVSFTVKGACWFEWDIQDGKVCDLAIAAWKKPSIYHSAVFGFVTNNDFAEKLFKGFSLLDEYCTGNSARGRFCFYQ